MLTCVALGLGFLLDFSVGCFRLAWVVGFTSVLGLVFCICELCVCRFEVCSFELLIGICFGCLIGCGIALIAVDKFVNLETCVCSIWIYAGWLFYC